jgi:RimJ/RimL family protein N-acetyltransferase
MSYPTAATIVRRFMARRSTPPPPAGVLLRDVVADDLPVLFEDQLDPDAARMAAFTPRDREAFMAHWTGILGDETLIAKAVVVDGAVAGNVVSFEQSGDRLVGYWIGKRHWGKGIATVALSQFLDLETTRPLFARVAKHNVASIRVLEKCGFAISGEGVADADARGPQVEELILKLGGQRETDRF